MKDYSESEQASIAFWANTPARVRAAFLEFIRYIASLDVDIRDAVSAGTAPGSEHVDALSEELREIEACFRGAQRIASRAREVRDHQEQMAQILVVEKSKAAMRAAFFRYGPGYTPWDDFEPGDDGDDAIDASITDASELGDEGDGQVDASIVDERDNYVDDASIAACETDAYACDAAIAQAEIDFGAATLELAGIVGRLHYAEFLERCGPVGVMDGLAQVIQEIVTRRRGDQSSS